MHTPTPPPQGRMTSLLGYTLISSLIIYLVYGFLQTIPLMYGMFVWLKTPIMYLTNAAASGGSAETIMQAWEKIIEIALSAEPILLFTFFSEIVLIFVVIYYCCKIEKLPIAAIGFVRKKAIRDYAIGIFVGALMLSAAVFICVKAGALTVQTQSVNVLLVILYFFAFLVQGMAEEVLFRGYIFRRLCLGYSLLVSALISSLLFAVMHISNNGMATIAFLNMVVFGMFASLLVYRCDGSIWCVGALHGVWNFAQGNLFGISVSGNSLMSSIFSSTLTQGRELTNGGTFGLEGGIAVTLVLVLATAILWMLPQRNAPKKNKK